MNAAKNKEEAQGLTELRRAVGRAEVLARRWGKCMAGWTLLLLGGCFVVLVGSWKPSTAMIVAGFAGEVIVGTGTVWAGSRQTDLDRRCEMAEWMR